VASRNDEVLARSLPALRVAYRAALKCGFFVGHFVVTGLIDPFGLSLAYAAYRKLYFPAPHCMLSTRLMQQPAAKSRMAHFALSAKEFGELSGEKQ